MKSDYTLEWLQFTNYEIKKKIKALKEKLEERKKEFKNERGSP